MANPSSSLPFLPAHVARFLLSSPSSSKLSNFSARSLPSIRCSSPCLLLEQKTESHADLMRNQSPKSGKTPRSRTLKRVGKKGSGRKAPVVAPQIAELDFDESAVAVLEQIYMGSPSFGSVVSHHEDEIATVSGREESSHENGGLFSDGILDSADSLRQSQHGNDRCIDTALKSANELPKTVGGKGRRRKNLTMRLSSRRKRLAGDEGCLETRSSSVRMDDFGRNPSTILCSERVNELVRQYGGNFNLMAQSWLKLRSELLTAEEEKWLASLLKPFKALHILKLRLKKRLSRDPTFEEWAQAAKIDLATLRRFIDVGLAARNKLVQLNLRLVVHQARKYYWEGCSLSVSDLCQEGVQGLMTGVDKFEPTKGFKFCTYAVYWIRNSILRAQTRSGYPIRSPFNFAELKLHIKKMTLELLWETGRGPTTKEIIERVGIDKLRYMMVMRSGRKWMSLHEKQKVTGCELIENVKDHNEDVQSKLGGGAGDAMLRLGIDDVLDSLKPKESLVLRQRFGLDGKGERSLGQIGRNLRMSREMARKYEARALLKLKHPTRLSYLRSFLPALHSSSA